MGGCGRTRWVGYAKKFLVEDSLCLDISLLIREASLHEGIHKIGQWHWLNPITGNKASSIGYEVDSSNQSNSWVRLFYTITQSGESVDYKLRLTTTRPNFGGLRWWFICPLVVNDRACYRRVGKLYLPYYARFYGCRHCYDLTYRSSQEADKRVYWLRRNPEALLDIVRNHQSIDPSKLFLAMKALRSRFA